MELVHGAGDDGFHDGHGGGQGRKGHGQEEQDAHDGADEGAHFTEDLGQGHEHQGRAAGAHALPAHEGIDRGNDHHAGQECHDSIEELDLVDGLVQVGLLLDVRTVGDHDAHCHADGIEQLAHGIGEDHQELLGGHALEAGHHIDHQALEAGAGDAGIIGVPQGHGEDGNTQNQDQQDRHQDGGELFNALIHTLVDHKQGSPQEQKEPENGGPLGGDKTGEIGIGHSSHAAAGEVGEKIFQNPAADGAVVGQDQGGDQAGDGAHPAELFVDDTIGRQGAEAGFPADGDLCDQQSEAEGQSQDQVAQQEQSAAVLGSQIGKTPDVAQAHGAAGSRQHEAQGTGERAPLLILFHVEFLQNIDPPGSGCFSHKE